MSLAENPDKTKNIVMPLMKEFERVYTPLLQGLDPRVEVNLVTFDLVLRSLDNK